MKNSNKNTESAMDSFYHDYMSLKYQVDRLREMVEAGADISVKAAYSVKELAHALDVTKATVYTRMRTGELPYITKGAKRYVLHRDYIAYLESQQGG